jgi:hypothetical protein
MPPTEKINEHKNTRNSTDADTANKLREEVFWDVLGTGAGLGLCAFAMKGGCLGRLQRAFPELEQVAYDVYGSTLKLMGKSPAVTRLVTEEGAQFRIHDAFIDGVQCKAITGTLAEHQVTVTNIGTRSVFTPQHVLWGERLQGKFQIEQGLSNFEPVSSGDIQRNKRLFNSIESNFYSGHARTDLFHKATELHRKTSEIHWSTLTAIGLFGAAHDYERWQREHGKK